MKRLYVYLLLVIALSVHLNSFSQKQTNTWYFGKNAGLNFNVSPPRVLQNGVAGSIEGTAAISDNNGNLLFYTNGDVIINKNNQQMRNGNNIAGHVSSTSNTVIVPIKDLNGIYYLFTIGAAGDPLIAFSYSVIDMNKENGLGEVTLKNALLSEESFEKMAAVRHCNKKDVWVVIRKWDSDEYHCYLVKSNGEILSPVISQTGMVISGNVNNSLGAIKFSPDGSKLAALHSFENDGVELMNFNNITGEITNPIFFKPNTVARDLSYSGVYGVEFSQNNDLLYISSSVSPLMASVLYQFDITSMDATDIMSTRQVIHQSGPFKAGALQAASDGKIYHTAYEDSLLSVIEKPNIAGVGCEYNYHKIFFSRAESGKLQYGLPGFIAGEMYVEYAPFNFTSASSCINLDVNFALNKTTGVTSVSWDFGDGTQSTDLAPVHTYQAAGSYTVSVTIFRIDCASTSEVVTNVIAVGGNQVSKFLPIDTTVCDFKPFILTPAENAQNYLWSTGSQEQSISINTPGLYWLELDTDGCKSRDSFRITSTPVADVNIGADTTVCNNKPVILDAGLSTGVLWSNGSTSRTIQVNTPGDYIVTVSNNFGCNATDTVKVRWGDCAIFIPNAFTPNGDGLNDFFSFSSGFNAENLVFNIYNRYGTVVFTSNDPTRKWDGKYKGKDVPMGVYPWMMSYKKNGFLQIDKGTVMVIR